MKPPIGAMWNGREWTKAGAVLSPQPTPLDELSARFQATRVHEGMCLHPDRAGYWHVIGEDAPVPSSFGVVPVLAAPKVEV